MHAGDMGAWGWWMMIGMMGIGPLLWIGLLAMIAWLPLQMLRTRRDRTTPIDLVEERYARGEIGREAFEQAKQDLA